MRGHNMSLPPLRGRSYAVGATGTGAQKPTDESDAPPVTAPAEPKRFIDRLDSASRKQFPICSGVLDYAPDALAAVAHISWLGNEKHNQGEPLHHARGKSMDHPDCILRHLSTRHDPDPAYEHDILAPVFHLAEAAWRSLMLLQEAMEKEYQLAMAPGAWED